MEACGSREGIRKGLSVGLLPPFSIPVGALALRANAGRGLLTRNPHVSASFALESGNLNPGHDLKWLPYSILLLVAPPKVRYTLQYITIR